MKLKTETNTPIVQQKIIKAARKMLGTRKLCAIFEHGQWWVVHTSSGAQWSVVDTKGRTSVYGFDFEQVSFGEDQ